MSATADGADPRQDHAYCAFFCEENIWQLVQEMGQQNSAVILISNSARQVVMWHQRAAPVGDHPVVWDYHVILARAQERLLQVYDLDSSLPWGGLLSDYVERSFADVMTRWPRLAPCFRVVAAEVYLLRFASDRSHMRDPHKGWRQPPPPWPEILPAAERPNLNRWLNMEEAFAGECCTLAGLITTVRRQCLTPPA